MQSVPAVRLADEEAGAGRTVVVYGAAVEAVAVAGGVQWLLELGKCRCRRASFDVAARSGLAVPLLWIDFLDCTQRRPPLQCARRKCADGDEKLGDDEGEDEGNLE